VSRSDPRGAGKVLLPGLQGIAVPQIDREIDGWFVGQQHRDPAGHDLAAVRWLEAFIAEVKGGFRPGACRRVRRRG